VPAATVPLACSSDALQRAQQRLEVLTDRCSARVALLQQAFEQLPAVARFDPFAVDARVPQQPGAEAVPAPRRRRSGVPSLAEALHDQRRSRPAIAPGASPEPAQPGVAGAGGGARPGMPTLAAGGAVPLEAAKRQGRGLGSALDDLLDGIGALADQGARQVAQLMQRHAAPATPAVLSAETAAILGAAGNVRGQRQQAAVGFGSTLAALRQGGQAQAGGQQGGRAQDAMQALADALGGPGRSAPQPLRAVGLAPMAMTELLLDALTKQGFGDQAGPLPVVPDNAAGPRRQAAPRASSRLVGPTAPGPGEKPASETLEAPVNAGLDTLETGEALARQISRLLLDQAWMRGVDLK
jgi:hypothetical protein